MGNNQPQKIKNIDAPPLLTMNENNQNENGQQQNNMKNQQNPVQDNQNSAMQQNKAVNKVFSNYIMQNSGKNIYQALNLPKKYTVSKKRLVEVFKAKCIKGRDEYLTKSKFNDAIEEIFNFPSLPELHYTFLSEKMFCLLDESRDEKIQLDEFLEGFSNVLTNKEYREKCK